MPQTHDPVQPLFPVLSNRSAAMGDFDVSRRVCLQAFPIDSRLWESRFQLGVEHHTNLPFLFAAPLLDVSYIHNPD